MCALDEVAGAIQYARERGRRPVLSFGLEEQFDGPLTPRQWARIQRSLGCTLPPLEFHQGHWFLPDGFATIWDLAIHAACCHLDWEQPRERTEAAWREAQIFAKVRTTLVNVGCLDPKDVVREARLVKDLGLV